MKKYILLILFSLGTAVWWTQNVKPSESGTTITPEVGAPVATVGSAIKQDFPYVQINNVKIPVEVAQTPAEVEKGLSGRASLDAASGILFIFPKPDYYRFWMPDMNFPIDIIWIREDRIVGISPDISNEFNPANPKFHTSPRPADRVLEANAGFAQNKNIKVNDTVIFNNADLTSPR